jgi:hypothetical protein
MAIFAAADLPDVGIKIDPLWVELQERARLQCGVGDIDDTINGVSYKGTTRRSSASEAQPRRLLLRLRR